MVNFFRFKDTKYAAEGKVSRYEIKFIDGTIKRIKLKKTAAEWIQHFLTNDGCTPCWLMIENHDPLKHAINFNHVMFIRKLDY